MNASIQGKKTPAQWAEEMREYKVTKWNPHYLTMTPDGMVMVGEATLEDGRTATMHLLPNKDGFPRSQPQSPSNPHGLSYRDAPDPVGGLRDGDV